MQKRYWIVVVFWLLAGCTSVKALQVTGDKVASGVAPMMTATPTVDWQATAQVAQATADEARRVNAEATAQHEQFLAVGLQATMSANELEQAKVWQTATWAPTSVPLTITAGANQYAMAEMHLQEVKIAATATEGAPELLLRQKSAEAYNADLAFGMEQFMRFAAAFFFIAIPVLMWVARKNQSAPLPVANVSAPVKATPAPSVLEMATPVLIKREEGGVLEVSLQVVPCSEEMLTEFAEGILSGEKTTRFEFWEGEKSLWWRDQYRKFRAWLSSKEVGYAIIHDPSGIMVLTADGEYFLRYWLETRKLPARMEFGNVTQEMRIITTNHRLSTAQAEL